jgi:hypothetical protein
MNKWTPKYPFGSLCGSSFWLQLEVLLSLLYHVTFLNLDVASFVELDGSGDIPVGYLSNTIKDLNLTFHVYIIWHSVDGQWVVRPFAAKVQLRGCGDYCNRYSSVFHGYG